MSVSLTYQFGLTAKETLATGVGGAANPVVKFAAFDKNGVLNANSTPAVTKQFQDSVALVAGAKTVDLTALVGANGTVDLSGLKVQIIRIRNAGANNMTFAEGSANGYELLGNGWSITLPPGGILQIYLPETAPDVGGAAKTIDVSGTGTQTFELSLAAG